eukprot:gene41361-51212_t
MPGTRNKPGLPRHLSGGAELFQSGAALPSGLFGAASSSSASYVDDFSLVDYNSSARLTGQGVFDQQGGDGGGDDHGKDFAVDGGWDNLIG